MPLTGLAKTDYQRQYMRARRAQKRAGELKSDPAGVVAKWCEDTLLVPVGTLAGQRFKLAPFQIDWLRGALAPDTKEAFLSCARKNGKSSLIAAVLLAYMVGPLNRENFRAVTISVQGSLAAELRENIELLAEASGLDVDVRRTPYPGSVTGHNNARAEFLTASEVTGNAISADVVIVDEAGLLKEKLRDMWESTMQSIASRNGRLWAISIRGHSPMFKELIDRAGQPWIFGMEYAAASDCDIADPDAWKAANPGLAAGIKSMEYMNHMSGRALSNAAYAPSFFAKDLNIPGDPSRHMIISVGKYRECLVDTLPDKDGPAFVGIDLGSSTSMSGAAVYWPSSGRLETWGAWPDQPNLAKRGKKDSKGSLYLQMRERGELVLFPGAVLPVNDFVRDAKARLRGARVMMAGADRHRYKELQIGMQVANVRWPVDWRSSKVDASCDVRAFQSAVLGGAVKTRRSLVLESAIKQSSVVFDALGHPTLDKSDSLSRIDCLSAAVIAVALGETWRQSNQGKRRAYRGIVK